MVDSIGEKSKKEGRAWSRLPEMDQATIDYIKGKHKSFIQETNLIYFFILGKSDYLGLNYYTSQYAEPRRMNGNEEVGFWSDLETQVSSDQSWPRAKSTWLYSVPEGLREMLK